MDKQILNFTVNEQILVCENPIKISTNKVNYIQASFDLGENWDGFDSVRAVWFNDFNCISTVLDSQGVCLVPFEVMKRNGEVKVNLVGSISENDVLTDRLTSYPVVAVIVDCTAQITGVNTQPITPSEYEQFVAAVHEDAERAEAGATASEQSAQNASDSATSAHNSAESAHDDKIAIEEAIAEVVQQIEDFEQVQVVVNTLPPTSPATSDFTDGVLTLGIPQGVKGDTGNGIQSITKTGTSGLVDTYTITFTDGQTTTFTVTNGAKGDTGNGIASIEKTSTVGLVDTYTITYTDGTTSTFTVTNGEKGDKGDQGEVSLQELEDATVVQTLSDSEPYNYRRTNNGNGSGHREYDEIVGASVGWNQLVQNGNFADDTDNWSVQSATYGSATASDGELTYTLSTLGTEIYHNMVKQSINTLKDHVYLNMYDMYVDKQSIVADIYLNTAHTVTINSGWNRLAGIMKPSSSYSVARYGLASPTGYSAGDTYKMKNVNIIDLTLFNSTIADYVYSLEQSTAGSGVAWLKTHFPKLFDNGYQPFDSGSIKSVSGLTAHEMCGVNLFDKSTAVRGYIDDATGELMAGAERDRATDFIKVKPSTRYYIKTEQTGGLWGAWYDADKNYLSGVTMYNNVTKVAPSKAHYVRLTVKTNTGNVDTFCINLSDTSINGKYFPYEKHTYPLDSSVTLRGQYKLDANNNLYADGDVWSSNGQITRVLAEDDLGSLDWKAGSQSGTFYANLTHIYPWNANVKMLCGALTFDGVGNSGVGYYGNDKTIRYYYRTNYSPTYQVYVKHESATSVSDLATLLAGAKLVYPLATPTTETAPTYENPQWCGSKGTEEYVGSELPVGHNTDYPMTMVDCADGLSNGTYTPKLTVTNGKLTFEWQSV